MAGRVGKCAWVVALSLAVACTLPDSGEFAAGKTADSQPDAAPDAAKPDTLTDGGSAADASGFETGAPVCPIGALFCDEFESTPVTAKWNHNYDDDGLIIADEGRAGHGLGVPLGARDGTKGVVSFVEQPIALEAGKAFTVSFDLDVSAVENVGIVDIDCFRYHGPFFSFGLRIADYGTGGVVHYFGDGISGGDPLYDEIPVDPLPADRWVRITCAVTYPTADPNVRILYDDHEVFNAKVPAQPYVGKPYVAAGVAKTDKAGPALKVRFDNFVITSP